MKKFLAILLSVLMVLGMCSVAFAGDNGTTDEGSTTGSITIKPSTTVPVKTKTLKAYKILNATYSGTGDDKAVSYSIPQKMVSFFDNYFGTKNDEGTVTATASTLAAAAGKTLDAYVTGIMGEWKDDSANIKDFARAALDAAKAAGVEAVTGTVSGDNVVFEDREAGYYVIEDTATAEPISAVMLDTVTDAAVEITLKASDITEKEIVTAGELTNNKANELGIGRDVEYKITQAIPDPTGYTYFYYMINDTLSTGLTFKPETVVVKVGTTTLKKDTDYYLYENLDGKTFVIAFENLAKDVADEKYAVGDTVTVTYSATVNNNAITGVNPNTNDANVVYSNNPNKDERKDTDGKPGVPANTTDTPVGEGPHKFTDTYTTKITIYKMDASKETKTPLHGVEFTLTGTSKDVVLNGEEVYEIDPAGTYYMLTDGSYTTTAPTTAPTLTETTGNSGWVEDSSYTGADARIVGGKVYRPYVESTDSTKTRYIIVEPNESSYASTTIKYKKDTKTADAGETYSVARVGLTDGSGNIVFAQLGAGSYKLSETGVLPGFNDIPDITFDLNCTLPDADKVIAGTEKAKWSYAHVQNGTIEFDEADGTFKITIDNNKGVELPSTGGIGTTIFYVLGSMLALAAVVLLIAKRRVNVTTK